MARPCTICNHPERAAIERGMLNKTDTFRGLAQKYRVSEHAIARHRDHMETAIAKAEVKRDLSIVHRLEALCVKALARIETAMDDESHATALAAAGILSRYLSIFAARLPNEPAETTDTAWVTFLKTHPKERAVYLEWYRDQRPAV